MNKLFTFNQHSPHLRFYMKDLLWVLIFTSMAVSCKIFEHFALQVDPVIGIIQLRSTHFKDSATLVPKLVDPPLWWGSLTRPPLNRYPIWIDTYFVLFKDVCYWITVTYKPDLVESTSLLLYVAPSIHEVFFKNIRKSEKIELTGLTLFRTCSVLWTTVNPPDSFALDSCKKGSELPKKSFLSNFLARNCNSTWWQCYKTVFFFLVFTDRAAK